MTARCDHCKHWGGLPSGEPGWWFDLFGQCFAILHSHAIQIAALRKFEYPDSTFAEPDADRRQRMKEIQMRAMREQLAYVADASDYDATLWTKPDFYCACFEEKGS